MRVEIIQGGQVLRQYNHEGQQFIEAPPEGDYHIRLTNSSSSRRLAVISVDGINVVDGSDAAHDGPGYVLRAWETVTIKGWRRTDNEVAAFRFNPQQGGGYAEQTGRGKKNTGVIGIAVFNEKVDPMIAILRGGSTVHHHHHDDRLYSSNCSTGALVKEVFSSNSIDDGMRSATMESTEFSDCMDFSPEETKCSATLSGGPARDASGKFASKGATKSRRRKTKSKGIPIGSSSRVCASAPAPEINTGYGAKTYMHTTTTEFERASTTPTLLITFRYAVRAKLIEWGVPVSQLPSAPEAFPASNPSVAAPLGWEG